MKSSHMKYAHIAIYIDLLFCLVIMPLIIMLAPVEKWIEHKIPFFISLVAYLYGLYFIYRKTKLPQLLMRRKFTRVLLLVASLLLITTLYSRYSFQPNDYPTLTEMAINLRKQLHEQTIWFFFLIVTGFSLSIELTFELFRQIMSKKEVEMEKSKAELALYKAQINPHFLFNTLNALYGLVLTKSEKTESIFIKFSNILKYMYSQGISETISIGQEMDYIQQYIDLQSLRLNHHTQVIFENKIENPSLPIAPMILITFVENCFKYGSSPDKDCTIHIQASDQNNCLLFQTENKIMRESARDSSQVGIENCRKRLELIYPKRHRLTIQEDDSLFKVKLEIQLT